MGANLKIKDRQQTLESDKNSYSGIINLGKSTDNVRIGDKGMSLRKGRATFISLEGRHF